MSNKTISINPSLFNIGGSKTKKNRTKSPKMKATPIISSNILKNKLLKRIKEHKNFELNKTNLKGLKDKKPLPGNSDNLDNFTDEFSDSINYLQTLSTQNSKQKRKEEIERKTIKNHSPNNDNDNDNDNENENENQLHVNLDLPDELQPEIITVNTEPIHINTPYKLDEHPYGVMKNGIKPSYKEWKRTQKNNIVTDSNASLIIQGNLNNENNVRENRLKMLKEKIKRKEIDKINSEILIQLPTTTAQIPIQTSTTQIQIPTSRQIPIQTSTTQIQIPTSTTQIQNNNPNTEVIARKYITTKTIKRKYTLGRNSIKNSVGILLKDRGTRKQILSAQKELKRKNINEVKSYLREHNLIKAGSNAPNDVLRKLYESSMLAGEVTNKNTDTLLYNFSKEEKEL